MSHKSKKYRIQPLLYIIQPKIPAATCQMQAEYYSSPPPPQAPTPSELKKEVPLQKNKKRPLEVKVLSIKSAENPVLSAEVNIGVKKPKGRS